MSLPRVAVIGVGGVGGILAAALETAGASEVTLVARGAALASLASPDHGVTPEANVGVTAGPSITAPTRFVFSSSAFAMGYGHACTGPQALQPRYLPMDEAHGALCAFHLPRGGRVRESANLRFVFAATKISLCDMTTRTLHSGASGKGKMGASPRSRRGTHDAQNLQRSRDSAPIAKSTDRQGPRMYVW